MTTATEMPPLVEDPPQLDEPASAEPAEERADDYSVPFEASFNGADYIAAPGLENIASSIIEDDAHLAHLRGSVDFDILWKRRGGKSRGTPRVGGCVMPSGLTGHYSDGVVYTVWLAADHCREMKELEIEAALHGELMKTDTDPNNSSAFRLRNPDFVGFVATLERYGLHNAPLVRAARVVRQLPLPGVADDA